MSHTLIVLTSLPSPPLIVFASLPDVPVTF
jgi:hypothetical protein